MKNKKVKIINLFLLSMLSSCSLPFPTSETSKTEFLGATVALTSISGFVEFPRVKIPQPNKNFFSTKAIMSDVRNGATVALLYPPGHTTKPNQTVATGLSNNFGQFNINPDAGFSPLINEIYVLEATKRIGNAGVDSLSVRTYIQWTGTTWKSITTPKIFINKDTTAIAIIEARDDLITASETIDKISSGMIANIGTVSSGTINKVAEMVDVLLTNEADPTRFINYQNGKYFVDKEISVNKNYLLTNKYCPNCDLSHEDFSNQNLSNADLSNTILDNVNFSGTNLSGVLWRSGGTCLSNSIGNCLLNDLRINSYTSDNQNYPNVAVDEDGDFVVVWQSFGQDGNGYGLYAQRYNSAGVTVGSEFRVNSYTTSGQIKPDIAMDADGDFVIVWESDGQDGSLEGIYAQLFDSNGATVGSEFRVNNTTTNDQLLPTVAMDANGDFVIGWQSFGQDGGVYGIYARRYTSSGIALGNEFRVNTFTSGDQKKPAVAMNSGGDFVLVWQSNGQDGGGYGIYSQRYTSSGLTNGSEIQINSQTVNSQINPTVAMSENGDFFVAWQSFDQDGSGYGVYAQRYQSTGFKTGSEFLVNSYTLSQQRFPSISGSASGDFVIAWQSNGQDGGGQGVYAQRYSKNGSASGVEFKVNTYTVTSQMEPKIAVDSAGEMIISWYSSSGQDGSSDGIYVQRYDNNGISQ